MGKASSSKKVQRAARAGSTSSVNRPKLGFPAAVLTVVVLGVGLVAYARAGLEVVNRSPSLDDHWHAAYGIYVCDQFTAPLVDQGADREGIHTHGDGLMHIHPFSTQATGDNARLDRWAEQTGLTFGADSMTLPTGETYTNGDDCNGTPGEVVVARWDDARTVVANDPDVTLRADFGTLAYTQDGSAVLIAFVPEGAELPKPDVQGLATPADLAPGESAPFDAEELPTAVTQPSDTTATTTLDGEAPATTMQGDGDTGSGDEGDTIATTTTLALEPTTTAP